jgi:SAM-dependent methyltransferase
MKAPTAREFFFPTRPLDPAAQVDVETRFFRQLRLPNGTYKTTYADRLPDVDAALCDLLEADRAGSATPRSPVRLLDVGVSSGITTLELLRMMEARGIAREAVAVDISVNAYLHQLFGIADVLCDANGKVLQIAVPSGVKGRPHDPEGSFARRFLQRVFTIAERVVGGPNRARTGRAVRLISPRLLERSDVTIVEHDLTRPNAAWNGQFDVVRAANILNLDYFDEPLLARMVAYLHRALKPDGILVLVRTHDDTRTNHATLFRATAAGLEPIQRVGDGSEIERLVVARSPVA